MCTGYEELSGGGVVVAVGSRGQMSAWARLLGPGSGRAQVRNAGHLVRVHS